MAAFVGDIRRQDDIQRKEWKEKGCTGSSKAQLSGMYLAWARWAGSVARLPELQPTFRGPRKEKGGLNWGNKESYVWVWLAEVNPAGQNILIWWLLWSQVENDEALDGYSTLNLRTERSFHINYIIYCQLFYKIRQLDSTFLVGNFFICIIMSFS